MTSSNRSGSWVLVIYILRRLGRGWSFVNYREYNWSLIFEPWSLNFAEEGPVRSTPEVTSFTDSERRSGFIASTKVSGGIKKSKIKFNLKDDLLSIVGSSCSWKWAWLVEQGINVAGTINKDQRLTYVCSVFKSEGCISASYINLQLEFTFPCHKTTLHHRITKLLFLIIGNWTQLGTFRKLILFSLVWILCECNPERMQKFLELSDTFIRCA